MSLWASLTPGLLHAASWDVSRLFIVGGLVIVGGLLGVGGLVGGGLGGGGSVIGGGLVLIGGLVLWRGYRGYRRQSVFRRLRCSVVMLQQGTLRVRTLCEIPVKQLSCGRRTVNQLVAAAPRATLAQPIPVLDTADARELRSAIAVCISSLTPAGHLRQALGMPTIVADFVAGMVSDAEKPPHQRRLRLLVVPRVLLEDLPAEPPQYEHAGDAIFWSWLLCLSRTWHENPLALAQVELAFHAADP